jgi:nucleoside 2-deoxyribosyltransferase
MLNNKAYLAGPDVFLPYETMHKVFNEKKRICKDYGFKGISPIDDDLVLDEQKTPYGCGLQIGLHCINIMNDCSFGFFNLTPWETFGHNNLGLHADVGTSFELGYMVAKGAKVYGYTNSELTYKQRLITLFDVKLTSCNIMTGSLRNEKGYLVEDYNMRDNLMLESGIHFNKGTFCFNEVSPEERFTNLEAFESIVKDAQKYYLGRMNNESV